MELGLKNTFLKEQRDIQTCRRIGVLILTLKNRIWLHLGRFIHIFFVTE